MNGGEALIKALELEGVEVIFGLPGGCILPVYDPIIDSPIRHILVRHEQGAGHMAEGYAHATGRPGVAMVTSGPGRNQHRDPAVRCLHGLDSDDRDHWPGPVGAIGTDAFQECDTIGITAFGDQAQRVDYAGPGHSAGGPTGVPSRHHRPPWASAVGHPKDIVDPPTRTRHGVVLADRRGGVGEPAGLQAHHQGASPKDQGSRRADHGGQRPVLYVGGGILKARAAKRCWSSPS
jgi:acetolactate synthase-1/2/3 large subunit